MTAQNESGSSHPGVVFGPPSITAETRQMALWARLVSGSFAALFAIAVIAGVLYFAEYARDTGRSSISPETSVTISIFAVPANAVLSIDGIRIAARATSGNNFFFSAAKARPHVLRMEKAFYLPVTQTVTIEDMARPIMLRLTLAPGAELDAALKELPAARTALQKRDAAAVLQKAGRILAMDPDYPEALRLRDEAQKIAPAR